MLERHEIRKLNLVGYSYSGATAIRLVQNYLELVQSLFLIEPMMACLLKVLDETEAQDELETIQNKFRARLVTKVWRLLGKTLLISVMSRELGTITKN